MVAYSGGVDSVFLAYVAYEELGDKSLAVIADTPSLPRSELREAHEIAERFGFRIRVVKSREFDNPDYTANPINRCYYCKHDLFKELVEVARNEGFNAILYGENASDTGDFRPGAQAAAELEVRAPLKEAGITKEEIRGYSRGLGLPTAEKAQMACLSSRVPYGEIVHPGKLRMVEEGEDFLRGLGFGDIRVRHHEVKGGHLARIEVGPGEMGKMLSDGLSQKIVDTLGGIGYTHVTLDLKGYRRGSANEVIRGETGGTG